jgi:hypothetical protein
MCLNSAFTTTGFTLLENNEYYKKWKERARRARKKFLSNSHLHIKEVSTELFQSYYVELEFKQPFKSAFRRFHQALSNFDNQ